MGAKPNSRKNQAVPLFQFSHNAPSCPLTALSYFCLVKLSAMLPVSSSSSHPDEYPWHKNEKRKKNDDKKGSDRT